MTSDHYKGHEIRAKAKAGFALYAASARAASVARRALAGGGDRGRRGGGMRIDCEVMEL